jgi:hypothetical protein
MKISQVLNIIHTFTSHISKVNFLNNTYLYNVYTATTEGQQLKAK